MKCQKLFSLQKKKRWSRRVVYASATLHSPRDQIYYFWGDKNFTISMSNMEAKLFLFYSDRSSIRSLSHTVMPYQSGYILIQRVYIKSHDLSIDNRIDRSIDRSSSWAKYYLLQESVMIFSNKRNRTQSRSLQHTKNRKEISWTKGLTYFSGPSSVLFFMVEEISLQSYPPSLLFRVFLWSWSFSLRSFLLFYYY